MKFLVNICLILNFLFADSGIFSFDGINKEQVIYSSSFWLGNIQTIDPISNNRLYIQFGLSSIAMTGVTHYLKYPNFDVSLKVTKNLSFTCKSYGFSTKKYHPFVLGAGVQYYFSENDTLDWSTSIQRTDLIGLQHFNLTSLCLDLRKWIKFNSYKFRIGAGSNFFKMNSFSSDPNIPNSMNGQINYLGIDIIIPFSIIIFGIDTRISSNQIISTFYMQKEFF